MSPESKGRIPYRHSTEYENVTDDWSRALRVRRVDLASDSSRGSCTCLSPEENVVCSVGCQQGEVTRSLQCLVTVVTLRLSRSSGKSTSFDRVEGQKHSRAIVV